MLPIPNPFDAVGNAGRVKFKEVVLLDIGTVDTYHWRYPDFVTLKVIGVLSVNALVVL
jgi:hypothetical protein